MAVSVWRRQAGDVAPLADQPDSHPSHSAATSTRVQRSSWDTAGLLHAPNCAAKPGSRRLRYKQTNLHSTPSPSRQPENRIKYPVILCCLCGRHTDLIITSRLADGAMHLQLRGELFPKTITITAAATSEGNGLREVKLKEPEIWKLITAGGKKIYKSRIWDINSGLVEKRRKFKKTGVFAVCCRSESATGAGEGTSLVFTLVLSGCIFINPKNWPNQKRGEKPASRGNAEGTKTLCGVTVFDTLNKLSLRESKAAFECLQCNT